VATTIMPAAPVPPPPTRPRWRWTRVDYHRLGELGLFAGRRVELIGGEILAMSPKRRPHRVATERARRALAAIFPEPAYTIWKQEPLALGEWDEPEPDLVVTAGAPEDCPADHPTPAQALLVVEIADSTLRNDLGDKADRYAAAGVEEYWVVDLPARAVEVCRAPGPDPASETGARYRERWRYDAGEAIAPRAARGANLPVAALLPGA
jgi:Uma2 family endonuclease